MSFDYGILELREFYEMIGGIVSASDYEMKQVETDATAHEFALNLGGGVRF